MADELLKSTGTPSPPEYSFGYDNHPASGMTLRDYFAGRALAGAFPPISGPEGDQMRREIAQAAFALADAMLQARKDK